MRWLPGAPGSPGRPEQGAQLGAQRWRCLSVEAHYAMVSGTLRAQLADSLCTWRLADELHQALAGGLVRRVLATGEAEAVVEVSVRRQLRGLLVSWQGGLARTHLIGAAPEPRKPGAFGAALQRLLEGATIAAVGQQAFDRVVYLELLNLGGLGPVERGRLILEATGRQANCVLVGSDGRIVAAARMTPARPGLYRRLAPGEVYLPPPGQDKLDPRAAEGDHGERGVRAEQALLEAVRARWQGMSDLLAAEVAFRAGLYLEAKVSEQPPDWRQRWHTALQEVLQESQQGRAWLYRDAEGLPALAYPVRLQHLLGRAPAALPSLSVGLELVGGRLAREQETQRLRAAVTRALRNRLERAQRLQRQRWEELQQARQADKWRRWGELLIANLPVLERAQAGEVVEVVDYYSAEPSKTQIPLLPGKGPRESAELYFAAHRKARRALSTLPALLAQAERDIEQLQQKLREAETTAELARLQALAQELGVGREEQKRAARREAVGRAEGPHGYTIFFGRRAQENDELLRMARPGDVWLHARGVRGAHVLIRTDEPLERLPRETLLWAARLAGRLSDYEADGVAEVDYTLARYVRKPRGAPPGFVIYTHHKTLTVALD
jgi:predicted ribosome quality control (RQC) complex YloA/Tae2 family protein